MPKKLAVSPAPVTVPPATVSATATQPLGRTPCPSKGEYLSHGNPCSMPDAAEYHWLWKETVNRLSLLQTRVNEGRDLDAALDFARFVIWSRLDRVLAPYDAPGPLKVDSAFLRWKAEELQRAVQDRFADGSYRAGPRPESSMEEIDRKLNIIAGFVATLRGVTQPALTVLSGGLDTKGGDDNAKQSLGA